MVKLNPDPEKNIQLLAVRIAELQAQLRSLDPQMLAARSSAHYSIIGDHAGEFQINLWDQLVKIGYPAFDLRDSHTQKELNIAQQALIMYYLSSADGSPLVGRWISFTELPDGRFYAQAFQGYTGGQLARRIGSAPESFQRAAEGAGGSPHPLGDLAFSFNCLPKVPLLVVFWQGDEDFPSTYQLLFDASVPHYLPTDACAIAGSMLTRKLISAL